MRRLRIILATPVLLFSVLVKTVGLKIIPADLRDGANKVF
jgi:hypothetical protein